MSFRYDINKRLSREHQNVIQELRRLDNLLASVGPDSEPNWSDTDVQQLMFDLKFAFESEVPNHFAIEEEELFPLLREQGLGDMVNLLLDEHLEILGLIREVAPIISKAATEMATGKGEWKTLFEKGGMLVSALSMHAEKEESGLVPAIDQLIDQESADRIFRCYQEK